MLNPACLELFHYNCGLCSECDKCIRIFKYLNIPVTYIKTFLYECIRTFIHVKFVCTNIFRHSFVSVLGCENNLKIHTFFSSEKVRFLCMFQKWM